jgi:hypothetical protein
MIVKFFRRRLPALKQKTPRPVLVIQDGRFLEIDRSDIIYNLCDVQWRGTRPMKKSPNKISKRELRKELRLTRPPRLEGKAKNARMNPVRKKKKASAETPMEKKMQGHTDEQRKNYQLASKRHP